MTVEHHYKTIVILGTDDISPLNDEAYGRAIQSVCGGREQCRLMFCIRLHIRAMRQK